MEKAKWKVVITNNETGQIDTCDTNGLLAIIAADGGCHTVFYTECNTFVLADILLSADKALRQIKKDCPNAYGVASIIHEKLKKEGAYDDVD